MIVNKDMLAALVGNFEVGLQIEFRDIMERLASEMPGEWELTGEALFDCFKRARQELFSKELTLSAGAASLPTNSP